MAERSCTWKEIISQPKIWKLTLEAFLDQKIALEEFLKEESFERVLVVGCGSTHYLSQTVASLITHRTGIPAQGLPASELWFYPNQFVPSKTLLMAISRSGTTTETIKAQESFRKLAEGLNLVITCYPESTLARGADFVLACPDAQEESVAQTRSFTSMLLLAHCLVASLVHDEDSLRELQQAPRALEKLMEAVGELPRELGEDLEIERIFFLGGGPLYGLANEAMLKTKEMSLSSSEAYHPLEFRHGPMSMVDDRTLVVSLLSDAGLSKELHVLEDMHRLGARTLALLEGGGHLFSGWRPDHVVQFKSGLSEWERSPLYLPVLQQMAFHRAVAKGLNPDRPTNLTAVVELDDE
jgi:glucosamine--fructose-6-phosphate aminotransferase (isomerizing)